jgi:AmmeMemoRadiSam system protein A
MDEGGLTKEEKQLLLSLAREAIEKSVKGQHLGPMNLDELPQKLREQGATFVTLTRKGDLRGCIGALEPYQPLAEDVREHAAAAALEDYRFPPVRPAEVEQIRIEISRLTTPKPLVYDNPLDLPNLLHPGVDGVVIRDGYRRATFLPQVWEKLPEPVDFLDNLCLKMGAPRRFWQVKKLTVSLYQVEEFCEED